MNATPSNFPNPMSHGPELTHLQPDGTPRMVDVGSKVATQRTALARGRIRLPAALMRAAGDANLVTAKGSVLHTAVVAGTQAVKRTASLIPFCHALPVESIQFTHRFLEDQDLEITCEVKVTHKTGVEMEALTGVSVALLTIYDMCKSAGQDMQMHSIEILRKTGGKADLQKTE